MSSNQHAEIRLLEPDGQARGDLFGRLMTDLFHSLGYHEINLNIPRSGREIDLRAAHRAADHGALAECKATAEPIGGADLNKFVGVLDAERKLAHSSIDGYFISLGGFRASAIAQEDDFSVPRFIRIAGPDVVRELISGKIVAHPSTVAATAGNCMPRPWKRPLSPRLELLAHPTGWFWCAVFSRFGTPTAYVLIHADGTPLGKSAATPIIESDHAVGGQLQALELIVPADSSGSRQEIQNALSSYQSFLSREYGGITVDGLPADEHVESKSIELSDLFVPVHLEPTSAADTKSDDSRMDAGIDEDAPFLAGEDTPPTPSQASQEREPVGTVIRRGEHLAVLGPPGGGKSTLLKRLAIAYGVPGRRADVDDDLPEHDWLPLVIRCRQLGESASKPFRQILQTIPDTAELPQHGAAFQTLTDDALRAGAALILVDGLDEIADSQSRVTFVKQLRTFLGTYPKVRLIVTSREAGFRIVAGALCDLSVTYRVADFDRSDIVQLTEAWTVLVDGDSPTTRSRARDVANTIVDTDRIRRLARNPLLLTTLLLVRRWVGNLPKKRTALYAKAIEVLLMTWNVEGHRPIDLDEAIPQLAYVAFTMTQGVRRSFHARSL